MYIELPIIRTKYGAQSMLLCVSIPNLLEWIPTATTATVTSIFSCSLQKSQAAKPLQSVVIIFFGVAISLRLTGSATLLEYLLIHP